MQKDFESRYHEVERHHWWFAGRRDGVVALLRLTGATASSRILDIGCAGGSLLRTLGDAGFPRVTGIDSSPAAIARCREQGLGGALLMDAARPDFAPGSFDVVVASDVLEHLDDPVGAARAWWRILAPGGWLIAFVPAFPFLWSAHDEANEHRRRYTRAGLLADLASAGFTAERSSYWNCLLFAPAALARLAGRLGPRADAGGLPPAPPPGPVNRALAGVLRAENRLLSLGARWPFGLSVLALARKPAEGVVP